MNIILAALFAGVTVQTAQLDQLYNDDRVVTNVNYTSDLPSDYTTTQAVVNIASSASVTNAGAVTVAKAYTDTGLANKVNKTNGSASGLMLLGPDGGTAIRVNPDDYRSLEFGIVSGGSFSSRFSYVLPTENGTFALEGNIPTQFPWSSVTGKPTTLAGYGINNAYTKSETDGKFLSQVSPEVSGESVYWDNVGLSIDSPVNFSYETYYSEKAHFNEASFDGEALFESISTFNEVATFNGTAQFYTTAGFSGDVYIDGELHLKDSTPFSTITNSLLQSAVRSSGSIVDRGYTPTNAVVALSRSVQYVSPSGGTVTVQKPTAIAGGIRDWVIYAYPTADTTISFSNLPHARFAEDSVTNALPANVYTAIYLTEIDPATETFAIGRAKLEKGW